MDSAETGGVFYVSYKQAAATLGACLKLLNASMCASESKSHHSTGTME